MAEHLARRTGVAPAEARLDALTAALADDPGRVDEYSDALEAFLALGGDDLAARSGAALAEVGLAADRLDVPMRALSGGQAARVGLAVLILARLDVLLLDEPTNDLDFAGLDVLEGIVDGHRGAVVTVSHDRAFLDRCVRRVVEVVEPSHEVREWAGGWTDYVAQRDQARERQYEAHGRYAGEKGRLEARMRRQRAWSEEGVKREKKRPKDPDKISATMRSERSEKQASKVRTTERAIERLEVVEKPWEAWRLQLRFASGPRKRRRGRAGGGRRRAWRVPPGPGRPRRPRGRPAGGDWPERRRQEHPHRRPVRPDPAGLGPPARSGPRRDRRGGTGAHGALRRAATLLDAFVERSGLRPEEARTLLAKFTLDADRVERRAEDLSPGERTRALLAILAAREASCLVLDEPTNHLDLEAIEQLEEALEDYDGHPDPGDPRPPDARTDRGHPTDRRRRRHLRRGPGWWSASEIALAFRRLRPVAMRCPRRPEYSREAGTTFVRALLGLAGRNRQPIRSQTTSVPRRKFLHDSRRLRPARYGVLNCPNMTRYAGSLRPCLTWSRSPEYTNELPARDTSFPPT